MKKYLKMLHSHYWLFSLLLNLKRNNIFYLNRVFAICKNYYINYKDERQRLKEKLSKLFYLKNEYLNLEGFNIDQKLVDELLDKVDNISYIS